MHAGFPSRLRRPLIAFTVLLAVAACVIILSFRWVFDPGAVRAAAERRLSAMLGQAVTIGDISVDLLPVPALVGSDIRVGRREETPSIDIPRVRFLPRLRSLFSPPVVVEEVILQGLVVSVLHDRNGEWRFPSVVPAPGGHEQGGIVIERVRLDGGRMRVLERTAAALRESSSIDEVAADVVVDGGGLRLSPITGRIADAAISGEAIVDRDAARLDFRMDVVQDGDLPALLALAGIERPAFVHLPKPAGALCSVRIERATSRLSGTGSVRAPAVSVEPLSLTGFEAPFKMEGPRLTFAPTAFSLYGGAHRGTITVDVSQTPARWALDSRVTDLDFGDFLTALTEQEQPIDGTAAISGALRGRVGEPLERTVQGRTQVTVVNGVIRQFPLLAAINRALRLAEGDTRDTRFDRLTATLAIASGQATTDDLVIQARDVRVEAAGRMGFDRSLDLAGQAVLSPERTASAIRSVRELSGLRNAQGELELPLTITGSLDNPSFRIDLQGAVGKSLKEELRRRIFGIIRKQ